MSILELTSSYNLIEQCTVTLILSERREGVGETLREVSADSEEPEGGGHRPIHLQGRHPGHHRGETRNARV